MNNTWIIAKREFFERVKSSSFKWMLFIGPITLLLLTYIMIKSAEKGKNSIDAIVTDKVGYISNGQILSGKSNVDYTVARNQDFSLEEFQSIDSLQRFDAYVEINEKIIQNKIVKVFSREDLSPKVKIALQLDVERRLEEVFLQEMGYDMSLEDFRKIKQSYKFDFINLNKLEDDKFNYKGYVGLVFSSIIVLFIALFGMSIVRSTAKEKSSRIVEVILASVKSRELMLGKIVGIGLAALVQFFFWSVIILFGLIILKQTVFPDVFDPSTWAQSSNEVSEQLQIQLSKTKENKFIEVIYHEIDYTVMILNFIGLFILSYLFYGSFFSWIGSMTNSESDGQQFTLPIVGILIFSLYMGYIQIDNPNSIYLKFFAYFPFTSAVIQLVRIAQGYYIEASILFYIISLFSLVFSTFVFLYIGAQGYKTNILNFSGKRRWNFWQSNQKI